MRPHDHAEEIERLVERGARDPRTHTFARLADLYRKVGELDRALEVVEAGLKHHPHYLNARLVHARLLRELGRGDEAVLAFERVLEIDSENRVARAALDELRGGPEAGPAPLPSPSVVPRLSTWLARLDAEWQHSVVGNGADASPSDPEEPAPADDRGAEDTVEAARVEGEADDGAAADGRAADLPESAVESSPEPAGPSAEPDSGPPGGDAPATGDAGSGDRELETATLARLYVSQGLHEQAVAIYERLLARDPYNARLAAALEEARRGGQARREAPRAAQVPRIDADAVPSAPPRAPRDEPSGPEPAAEGEVRDGTPDGQPIGVFLTRLLEGRAPVDGPSAEGRPWPEWLRKIGSSG